MFAEGPENDRNRLGLGKEYGWATQGFKT